MRTIALITIFLLSFSVADAQYTLGIEAGMGIPVMHKTGDTYHPSMFNNSMRVTPTFGISCISDYDRTINLGVGVYFEQYSLIVEDGVITPGFSSKETINHTSNHIFLAPMLDVGIGRYRYLRLGISPELGFLAGSNETVQEANDHTYDNTSNVSLVIFRLATRLQEHIEINDNWCFTFTESYSFMPIGQLSTNSGFIHPGYVALLIGVTRHHR